MGIVIVDVHSWEEVVPDDFTIWDSFPGRFKEALKWSHRLQKFPSMIEFRVWKRCGTLIYECRSQGHVPFPSWNALHEPSSLGYLGEKHCIILYQSCLSSSTDSASWYALSWFVMLTGVCFSHDHFHCQLRTCMFWSQTCNEKADGLEIRQGIELFRLFGPFVWRDGPFIRC